MYKWMQENSKRIMVIFAVGLMIVFILPTTVMRTMGAGDPTVAYVNDQPVSARTLDFSRSKWQWLSSAAIRMAAIEQQFRGALGTTPPPFRILIDTGLIERFDEDPDLFFMLVQEARQLGIGVNRDSVEALRDLLTSLQLISPPASLQEANYHREALTDLLLLNAAVNRATSTIKVSQPRVQQQLATQFQHLYLNLVDFHVSDFLEEVPEPTAEQVRAHIDRYGDVDPDNIDEKQNPHGFSYRLPHRLKLQYIEIPVDQVRAAVERSQEEFDWRREAYRYYQNNLSEFPATQPGDSDEVDQILGQVDLSLGGAPSTRPTTRPFEEVYEDIKRNLIQPQVDRQLRQIEDRVLSLLQRGYERHQAIQADREWSGRLPIEAAYTDYAFLREVAALIQKEYGISLNLVSLENDWLALDDVNTLTGIGQSIHQAGTDWQNWLPFTGYLQSRIGPFHGHEDDEEDNHLQVYEPTLPFTDSTGNVYIARVTAIQPAHAPTTDEERQEVTARAIEDLKKLAAYEKALETARQLREQAESDRLLQSAANQADRELIQVGPVGHTWNSLTGWRAETGGYDLDLEARERFIEQAMELLRKVTDDRQHPTHIIELPRAGRVAVVEIDRAEPKPLPQQVTSVNLEAETALTVWQRSALAIQRTWLDPDQIRQRTGWREEN